MFFIWNHNKNPMKSVLLLFCPISIYNFKTCGYIYKNSSIPSFLAVCSAFLFYKVFQTIAFVGMVLSRCAFDCGVSRFLIVWKRQGVLWFYADVIIESFRAQECAAVLLISLRGAPVFRAELQERKKKGHLGSFNKFLKNIYKA